MPLAVKRRNEDLNEVLATDFDGVWSKKTRRACVVKFNMNNQDVKKRVFHVLKVISTHLFATPFLRCSRKDHGRNFDKAFDDVLDRVKENVYNDSNQVFDDLLDVIEETVLSNTKIGTIEISDSLRILNFTGDDVLIMAAELKRKIFKLQETLFDDSFLTNYSVSKCEFEKADKNIRQTDKFFDEFKAKFPSVPQEILLTKALDISTSKNVKYEEVIEELNKICKIQPKVKYYKFYPSRTHEFEMEKAIHSYIAGYQFHKMISKLSNAPVPMRTVFNISDAIESITYIENKESSLAYEEQKKLFRQQGKVSKNGKVDEILLFHGTAVSSLESIAAKNFIVDALPQQKNTQNEQRKKTMLFGRGIYFSELPAVSLMYGNGLLLCKVMPGNCEVFKPQGVTPPSLSDDHDSREVLSHSDQGVIHVIKKPSQILPYCVIQLRKQSLSSQYIKPRCIQQSRAKLSSPSTEENKKENDSAQIKVLKSIVPSDSTSVKLVQKINKETGEENIGKTAGSTLPGESILDNQLPSQDNLENSKDQKEIQILETDIGQLKNLRQG